MTEYSGKRGQGGQFGLNNDMAKKGALTKRKQKYEDDELARKEFLKQVVIAEKKYKKKFWELVLDNCFGGDNVLLSKIAMKMLPEIVNPGEDETGHNVIVVNYSDLQESIKKGKK